MVDGSRSRSVRLLAVVLVAGALVAVSTAAPRLLRPDHGVVDVQPGLLVAERPTRGIITLGEGVTVSLYAAGLQVQHQDRVLFRTVHVGSPLSAGLGSVTGSGADRTEHIDATLDNLRVTSWRVGDASATYGGQLYGGERSIPVSLTIERVGAGVTITARAPAADLLVLHTAWQPAARGVPPTLPAEPLGGGTWWTTPRPGGIRPLFTGAGGVPIGLDQTSDTAIDLSHGGRGEIHVWDSTLRLSVNQ